MLQIKPTKNLLGVTISGDYEDLSTLMQSIYDVTSYDNESTSNLFSIAIRLLGLCYDIRHASYGHRNVFIEKNGLTKEKQDWLGVNFPEQNVYYSFNAYFPEVLFLALAVPTLLKYNKMDGLKNIKANQFKPSYSYQTYLYDNANINLLISSIWKAFEEVVGEEEVEKIIKYNERKGDYFGYIGQYIDELNLKLLKVPVEERSKELRLIARRIIKKTQAYFDMEESLKIISKKNKCSIHETYFGNLNYPQEDAIDW